MVVTTSDEETLRGRAPRPRIGALEISDDEIETMVSVFYARVRKDAVLAPLFAVIGPEGWQPHLAKMCDFWSSILQASGRYKGAPMAAHIPMGHLQADHFERWLALFQETIGDLFEPQMASAIMAKAENIAKSLHYGIASRRGEFANWDPASRRPMAELEP